MLGLPVERAVGKARPPNPCRDGAVSTAVGPPWRLGGGWREDVPPVATALSQRWIAGEGRRLMLTGVKDPTPAAPAGLARNRMCYRWARMASHTERNW